MINQRFGRWVVLERCGSKRYSTYTRPLWLCRCECGTEKVVEGSSLRNGGSLSCGCLNDEITRSQGTKKEDMIGKRFGRLLVVEQVIIPGRTGTLWRCRCDCGNEKVVRVMLLKKGTSTSCGCYSREITSKTKKTHGLSNHPTYGIWVAMMARCTDHTALSYKNYGGRGITVCERWEDVRNFIADMGKRPSKNHSLERIDNEKGYSPDNCKWGTKEEQAKNTRRKSTTGVVGVSYIKARNKYNAYISVNKKQISVGVFELLEDAIKARKDAEIKYYKSSN